jgi:hypothetical protein
MVEGWMAAVAIAGLAVTAAGVSYQVYSGTHPPASPKQANAALASSQKKLTALQAKLTAAQTAGKDTSKIQTAIADLNTSMSYLQKYISGANPTSGTPVASPAGSTLTVGNATNWPLVVGGSALAFGAGWAVYSVVKKKRKKK